MKEDTFKSCLALSERDGRNVFEIAAFRLGTKPLALSTSPGAGSGRAVRLSLECPCRAFGCRPALETGVGQVVQGDGPP